MSQINTLTNISSIKSMEQSNKSSD